jgi:[ribosomal protein S5]-alanine N-acetyltransferase
MSEAAPLDVPSLHIHLPQPVLRTARLTVRPLREADAAAVQAYCSDREVASTTLHIPHPYPEGGAMDWIRTHPDAYASGLNAVWAMDLQRQGLVGVVGLGLQPTHRRAELGYWVGRPFWGRGIASEAAAAVVACAFDRFGVHRVHAHHFTRNPASGAVLRHAGLRHEGTLRGHVLKWGVFEDVDLYGVTRDERDGAARCD